MEAVCNECNELREKLINYEIKNNEMAKEKNIFEVKEELSIINSIKDTFVEESVVSINSYQMDENYIQMQKTIKYLTENNEILKKEIQTSEKRYTLFSFPCIKNKHFLNKKEI